MRSATAPTGSCPIPAGLLHWAEPDFSDEAARVATRHVLTDTAGRYLHRAARLAGAD
ncbi:MAG: hypothetical protein QOC98_612, partial [Frankiaceae bacterium]|nr:hypothetical protein [Frankiaceae bacterium]